MSKKYLLKQIKRSFVKQYNQNFCGLACLTSIIRFYGGDVKQEKLTEKSGTTYSGTTLLGLYTASKEIGLIPEGFEAKIKHLKKMKLPVILHTVNSDGLEHFMVCYGYYGNKFIIGDPGWGIVEYTDKELETIWKSKSLLIVKPGKNFIRKYQKKKDKGKWFTKLIKEDIPILIIAALIGIIISACNLATAIFSQKLIDQILPDKDQESLITGLILFGLVLLVKGFLSYIRGFFLIRQSREMNNRIISYFFDKILFLPKSFFISNTIGDMTTRMHDITKIQGTIIYITSNLIIDILIIISSIIYISFLSFSSGMISLVCLPIIISIIWRYNDGIIKAQRDVMQAYASTENKYIDILKGINIIKSSNKEKVFSRIVKRVYDYFQMCVFRLGIWGNKIDLITQIMNTLVIMALIWWTSHLVLANNLMLGQMMAIITLITGISGSATKIALANIRYQEANIAFDRMYEFTSILPESDKDYPESKVSKQKGISMKKIVVRNLNFRWPGKTLLFKNINLVLKKGIITSFYGEIGCGKSTLLSILLRFHSIESGKILIDNVDWGKTNIRQWRDLVSVVYQDEKLFNGTVIDNICLSDKSDMRKNCIEFCKEFGFDDLICSFQQGYDTIITDGSSNISGGQKQIIALARALFREPAVLLLDESTASMDRKTEQFVINLLQKLKMEIIIVLVSHRTEVVLNSDFIYILENKSIRNAGTPQDLLMYDNLFSQSYHELKI